MVEGLVPFTQQRRTQDPWLLALSSIHCTCPCHSLQSPLCTWEPFFFSSFGFSFLFCWFFCVVFFLGGWSLSSFNILVAELAALELEPRSIGPQIHELTLWGTPKAQVRSMLLFRSVPQPWIQLVLQVMSISWEGVNTTLLLCTNLTLNNAKIWGWRPRDLACSPSVDFSKRREIRHTLFHQF